MPVTQAEDSKWAAGLASRLKLLQVNCADDTPVRRQATIAEELKRALAEIPAGRRKDHLAALSRFFPVWGSALPGGKLPSAESKPTLEQASPAELVERLVQALPNVTGEERLKLTEKLKAAGLVVTEERAAMLQPPEPLQKACDLPAGRALDPDRVLALLSLLLEAVLTVDQFAWVKWTDLSPNSSFKRTPGDAGDLRKLVRGCLSEADPEVATRCLAQLGKLIGGKTGRTTRLTAEMLVDLHGACVMYGREFIGQFDPEAIKDVMGGRGFFGNWKERCWDKYMELFRRECSTPEAMARKIKDCYARLVERNLAQG